MWWIKSKCQKNLYSIVSLHKVNKSILTNDHIHIANYGFSIFGLTLVLAFLYIDFTYHPFSINLHFIHFLSYISAFWMHISQPLFHLLLFPRLFLVKSLHFFPGPFGESFGKYLFKFPFGHGKEAATRHLDFQEFKIWARIMSFIH